MKIFIGSSSEARDAGILDEVALWIEEKGHEPLPWTTPTLFPPGAHTLSTLVKIASEVGGAIFVYTEDDKTWYRNSQRLQPRDNVILEHGLFMGRLEVEKSIICLSGSPSLATDLEGLTYINLNNNRRAKIELFGWIDLLVKSSRIPSTKSITCHTNKYAMDDSNAYWSSLRASASRNLVIIGDTNKSWISRDPAEAHMLANQLVLISEQGGKSAIISSADGIEITRFFIFKYLHPVIKSMPDGGASEAVERIAASFTYGVVDNVNYKAVLSDNRLVILPNMAHQEFRDESMVIEIHEDTHPVEFGYYTQDIRRIIAASAKDEFIEELKSSIDA